MATLIALLANYGMDVAPTLRRFMNDELFYESCFDLFLNDKGFETLKQQLDSKNYKGAFTTAHALKGVAANLGLTPLYDKLCTLVEALRTDQVEQLPAQYQAIMQEMEVLRQLKEA